MPRARLAIKPLLAQVKQDIQQQSWRVYDERRHKGQVRHLALRIGRRTEMLLTMVVKVGFTGIEQAQSG